MTNVEKVAGASDADPVIPAGGQPGDVQLASAEPIGNESGATAGGVFVSPKGLLAALLLPALVDIHFKDKAGG